MKLFCKFCNREEEVKLLEDSIIQYSCGETHLLSYTELDELFRRYGGER